MKRQLITLCVVQTLLALPVPAEESSDPSDSEISEECKAFSAHALPAMGSRHQIWSKQIMKERWRRPVDWWQRVCSKESMG